MNICVGERNYRPWIVFVGALFVWAGLGSYITLFSFVRTFSTPGRLIIVGYRPTLVLAGLASTLATLWLSLLLIFHAYLIWLGITTFEWIKRGSEMPLSSNCDGGMCGPSGSAMSCAPLSRSALWRQRVKIVSMADVDIAIPSTVGTTWVRPVNSDEKAHQMEDMEGAKEVEGNTISKDAEKEDWAYYMWA